MARVNISKDEDRRRRRDSTANASRCTQIELNWLRVKTYSALYMLLNDTVALHPAIVLLRTQFRDSFTFTVSCFCL